MEQQKEQDKNLRNKVVETYAGDMTRVIDGSEGIYVKKIIQEQEKREEEHLNLSPESKKNKNFMIIGIVLIVLALTSIASYLVFKKEAVVVDVPLSFSPLIYLDNIDFISIDGFSRDQISQSIYNESITSKVKIGGVEGIYLTLNTNIVGFKNFLALIAPEQDRSKMKFVSDNFLIGVTNSESKDLFILIKSRSFLDVFDIIKNWERKMFNDLHGIFGIELNADTKYLLTKDFEDGIVQNRNARILKDNEGNIVIMYVFIDDTSILITRSEKAAREMQLRLSTGIIRK